MANWFSTSPSSSPSPAACISSTIWRCRSPWSALSYIIYSGVQDAMTQWWYGHNAVGFFLTAGFLGMMYYFVPKRAERPIYSYRLSVVHFWSLIFIYIWAGPHHLHYTALPDWAQTLGMTFSVFFVDAVVGGMINGLMTPVRGVGQAEDGSRHPHAHRRRRLLRHVDL
ncbi:MAG: cbb3-type cytochrome c oxidase subunit I [Hyphomicrobiales bacterium]